PFTPRFPGGGLRAARSHRRGADRARRLSGTTPRHQGIDVPPVFAGPTCTDESAVPAAAATGRRGAAQGRPARIAPSRRANTTMLAPDPRHCQDRRGRAYFLAGLTTLVPPPETPNLLAG